MNSSRSRVLTAFATGLLIALPLAALAQPQPAGGDAASRDRAAIEAAFKRADVNKDGKLSRAEAEMLPSVAARFDDIDKAKKGYLTMDEFIAAVASPPS